MGNKITHYRKAKIFSEIREIHLELVTCVNLLTTALALQVIYKHLV